MKAVRDALIRNTTISKSINNYVLIYEKRKPTLKAHELGSLTAGLLEMEK